MTEIDVNHYDQKQLNKIVENQLTHIGEALEDGLLTCRAQDGVILQANRGANRLIEDRLVGRKLSSVLDFPDVRGIIHAALESNITQEFTHHFKSTVDRQFRIRLKRLDDERIAVLVMDMTLQRNLDKVRRDFVANVSHELRTPLTSVLGFVETLKGPAGEDKATRDKFLSIVESQSARMVRLVSDQLSLSSIERQEAKQPRTIIPVIPLAERVTEILAGQAEEHGIRINLISPDDEVMVIGDSDELTQMLQNLVENAIRYGQNSDEVRIIITADDTASVSAAQNIHYASIAVEDQGEGIDSSHIPRLTERFYRIDKGRSRDNGGTGLGLAIVKHIVNRHRGQLVITSEPGNGSRFCVLLPKPAG